MHVRYGEVALSELNMHFYIGTCLFIVERCYSYLFVVSSAFSNEASCLLDRTVLKCILEDHVEVAMFWIYPCGKNPYLPHSPTQVLDGAGDADDPAEGRPRPTVRGARSAARAAFRARYNETLNLPFFTRFPHGKNVSYSIIFNHSTAKRIAKKAPQK